MFNRHKHIWKVIDKTFQEGQLNKDRKGRDLHIKFAQTQDYIASLDYWLITYRCETCGTEKVSKIQ